MAINTQVCNNMNWYLFENVADPNGQIEWIINELNVAESKREKVYIIGHIPMSSEDCLEAWGAHFNTIISRFSNTILGTFFGHRHTDSFALYRGYKNRRGY